MQRRGMRLALLLLPTLVLSQVCTDIDFDGAELTVSNLGGTRHCCTVCSHDAAGTTLCCPAKGKSGDVRTFAPTPLLHRA